MHSAILFKKLQTKTTPMRKRNVFWCMSTPLINATSAPGSVLELMIDRYVFQLHLNDLGPYQTVQELRFYHI